MAVNYTHSILFESAASHNVCCGKKQDGGCCFSKAVEVVGKVKSIGGFSTAEEGFSIRE